MVLGGVVVVLLGGCGGSSKSAGTHVSSTSAPASTSTTATTPASGLEARVLTSNELSGFTAQPAPVERNPRLYLIESSESGSQLAADTARLKRLGFKGAVSENLNAPGQAGLSLVEQLGSVSAARSEVTGDIQHVKSQGGTYATFPVSGIPGAIGFSLSSSQGDGINITWAAGPYFYLVGETISSLDKSSEEALNAAARHLYQRLHG